jgi:hypothetical protein
MTDKQFGTLTELYRCYKFVAVEFNWCKIIINKVSVLYLQGKKTIRGALVELLNSLLTTNSATMGSVLERVMSSWP